MTKEEIKILEDFADKLADSQEDLPPEFQKFLNDNWLDLLAE